MAALGVSEVLNLSCESFPKLNWILQDELTAFHAAHFSATPTNHFTQHFLGPVEEGEEEYYQEEYFEGEEEDDGLGYYADGVKRTLTDEQIAIFRHSEIETLLRERRHAEEAKVTTSPVDPKSVEETKRIEEETPEHVAVEDGEVQIQKDVSAEAQPENVMAPPPSLQGKSRNKDQKSNRKMQKAQVAHERGWFKATIKPDLRKRTWDKVEDSNTGNLDYGEDTSATRNANPPPQRRKISYDD